MAIFYVRSTDGNDGDNGSTWALAKATLAGAFAAMAAGDTVYVSQAHAETQASAMTLTSPGTAANPCLVLCANDGAEPPTALATTATISTTGANNLAFAGFAYCYGITFTAGTGAVAANCTFNASTPWGWVLEACALRSGTSSTTAIINAGNATTNADDQYLDLLNTTLQFGNASQAFNIRGARVRWRNTVSAITGATLPTTLFKAAAAFPALLEASGVDFSALTSGKNLVDQSLAAPALYRFANCKLGSSVSMTTGTNPGPGGAIVEVYNCDSGDTNYRSERYEYQGSTVTVTDVVRSGGATDGTTAIGWKLVSGANARFISPLATFPIIGWLTSTGSQTLTVQYIHGGANALNNDEIWFELEYLGTSGFPLSVLAKSAKADILASAAANTADTAQDWDNGATARANSTAYSLNDIRRAATPNGRLFIITTAGTTGGSEPAAFATANDGDSVNDNTAVWRCMRREKVSVTVTVQELGPVRATLLLGKASTTVWVDPHLAGVGISPQDWMVPLGGQAAVSLSSGSGSGPLIGPGRLVRN